MALETERHLLWELCEGNLEGGSFTGNPEEYVKLVRQTDSSLHWGPVGEPGRGFFATEFDRRQKKALKRTVYLWDLCGEPRGRAPLLRTLKAAKTCQGRLWKWSTSLLIKYP
jgi:hypothetical protein